MEQSRLELDVGPELSGVWLASKEQMLSASKTATAKRLSARFSSETLERLVDAQSFAVVVPFRTNHPLGPDRSYRCLVSIKRAGRNERVSTLMDFIAEDILTLQRPTDAQLHAIVRGLIEAQEQVNLDSLV